MTQRLNNDLKNYIYEKETYLIRGAIFEVYKTMGCGFLESVYQKCLEREFEIQKIPFVSQQELLIKYKGESIGQKFKPDFICFEKVIVKLKAMKKITDEHRAQLFNYLKAGGMKLGLLVNFGNYPKVAIERIVV